MLGLGFVHLNSIKRFRDLNSDVACNALPINAYLISRPMLLNFFMKRQFESVSCFSHSLMWAGVAVGVKASVCKSREPGSSPGGGRGILIVQKCILTIFIKKKLQNDILRSNFKLFYILSNNNWKLLIRMSIHKLSHNLYSKLFLLLATIWFSCLHPSECMDMMGRQ